MTRPPTEIATPAVVRLSDAQLRAYNARDIDAFCACFAEDVVVLDADGAVTLRGIEAFRARYGAMFDAHAEVHADVVGRLVMAPHVVEHEIWRRRQTPADPLQSGQVLVRYTEREGRIAVAQFLG